MSIKIDVESISEVAELLAGIRKQAEEVTQAAQKKSLTLGDLYKVAGISSVDLDKGAGSVEGAV